MQDGSEFGRDANVGREWDEAARIRAQTYVDDLARRLTGAGVEAAGEARVGPAARAIVAAADEARVDAIVMSTHARTGPLRAVLGSVADEVMRTAQRPVLLVRHGIAEAPSPMEQPLRVAHAGPLRRRQENLRRPPRNRGAQGRP
jgi:Universal stress protein family